MIDGTEPLLGIEKTDGKLLVRSLGQCKISGQSANEIAKYYQWNVDPTARPLAINVDYNDALQRSYHNLRMVMNGVKAESNLEVLERSYYNSCQSYKTILKKLRQRTGRHMLPKLKRVL